MRTDTNSMLVVCNLGVTMSLEVYTLKVQSAWLSFKIFRSLHFILTLAWGWVTWRVIFSLRAQYSSSTWHLLINCHFVMICSSRGFTLEWRKGHTSPYWPRLCTTDAFESEFIKSICLNCTMSWNIFSYDWIHLSFHTFPADK